jgi:hypothetical protein
LLRIKEVHNASPLGPHDEFGGQLHDEIS